MTTTKLIEADFAATLFPLKTTLLMARHASGALEAYIARVLSNDPVDVGYNFLPQMRVYAAKPRGHLRRTFVLDPVATYFLYDIVYRNRASFVASTNDARQSFGYSFDGEAPISVHKAFGEFRDAITWQAFVNSHSISFDVASYFNSIYHHDFVNWFAALDHVTGADVGAFGKFFRELNAGRSIDFLPQGIYPAKVLGSAFLRYVDDSGILQSQQLFRFMDDFCLFDDRYEVLMQDFGRIQHLLGLKSLNVNPSKTLVDRISSSVHDEANSLKSELASIARGNVTRTVYLGSAADDDFDHDLLEVGDEDYPGSAQGPEDEEGQPQANSDDVTDASESEAPEIALPDDKLQRLRELLVDNEADEHDVELILAIFRDYGIDLGGFIPGLLMKFPNIAKQLHGLCATVADKEVLARTLSAELSSTGAPTEYQCFWLAAIVEDHLISVNGADLLLLEIYNRFPDYKIVRAKVLEIPVQSAGLKEIRAEVLKSGASDWVAWAAAMGTRSLKKAERNYALKYFSKGSPMNYIVAACVEGLPETV